MSDCPPVCLPVTANLDLLAQGEALLDRLSPEDYVGAGPGRSAVGAQYRHVLEHYLLFLAGLGSGRVDYDARSRDVLVETDREAAGRLTRSCRDGIARIGAGDLERPLTVHLAASAESDDGSGHGSTVGRELLFLLSHTVHHFAIIRLLLEDRGVDCEPDFGMAPSTLAHRVLSG